MKRDIPINTLNPFDKIKDALSEWAGYMKDKASSGYPKSSAFSNERVQSSNTTDSFYENIPDRVIKLDKLIESLAPAFKRILNLEYMDKRPTKTKAHLLGIPRQVFYQRISWIYEQLNFSMYEE